jgi:hypothetical protein
VLGTPVATGAPVAFAAPAFVFSLLVPQLMAKHPFPLTLCVSIYITQKFSILATFGRPISKLVKSPGYGLVK